MQLSGRGFIDRLTNIWQRLAGSLWFVPGVIVVFAGALAVLLVDASVYLDQNVLRQFPRLFGATPESSSRLLSTVAGTIVTVAGVTFSILVVAVSQASTQYSPRVLRNFLRDRLSQVTLGLLVGVFVYCLVVLRTIRSEEDDRFVPALAVLAALVLAVAAVALLVYFIHHIATSLEVGTIVQRVTRETLAAIDRQFPEELTTFNRQVDGASAQECLQHGDMQWWPVNAAASGFIQYVEIDALSEAAAQQACIVRLERRVGDFVVEGTTLLQTLGAAPLQESRTKDLQQFFAIQSYRTTYQDASFGVRQIVDIANKALSPGINDPTTAVTCIEYLSVILARLAVRQLGNTRRSVAGRLCLIVPAPALDEFMKDAFNELRRSGKDQPRVLASILRALEVVARQAQAADVRKAAVDQVRLVRTTAVSLPGTTAEREGVLRLCDQIAGSVPTGD